MKERIGYYDIARGLGIIFVVIGHIDSFYMPFRSYVIYFHMALFLIISGMLIMETGEDQRALSVTVRKKALRIMVPYFGFSFLAIVIEGIRLLAAGIFYWPHLRSLLITTFTLQGNSVMWFLPALFLSELYFLVLRKVAVRVCEGKRKTEGSEQRNPAKDDENQKLKRQTAADLLTVVLVVLVVGCVIYSNIFELSFYAGRAGIEKYERMHEILSMLIRSVVCTFLVCAGYFVRKYILSLRISARAYGGLSVLLLVACGGVNYMNPGVDLRALDWGDSDIYVISFYVTLLAKAFLYLAGAVCGALGIVFLCKASEKYASQRPLRMLAFLGTNSLIIMATHIDFHVLHVGMDVAGFLNQFVDDSCFYHVCLLIFVFAMEAVLIQAINRYFPVLTGKIKKKNEKEK